MLQITTTVDVNLIQIERIEFNQIKQAKRGAMVSYIGDLYSVLVHCHERSATIPYSGDRVSYLISIYDCQRDKQIGRLEADSTLTYDDVVRFAQQTICAYWTARQQDRQ